jgi:Tfp pilus assembly protein PilF
MNADAVEFLTSVLLDAGQPGAAQQWASRWLARHTDPNSAIRLAGLLDSKGRPAQALPLIAPYQAEVDTNPALLAEWVHLQVVTGASDTAYDRLNQLYRARNLPDEAVEPLLDMVLARHDIALAVAIADERGFGRLPNWLLVNLAEAAMAANRMDLVHRVAAGVKMEFFEAEPLLAARLALARGDRAAAGNWFRLAAASRLRDSDRLSVAEGLLQLGFNREAFDQMSELHLESLPEDFLRDLYYAASERQQNELALAAARRLYGNHPTDANRLLLATSLTAAGRPMDALPYLRLLLPSRDRQGAVPDPSLEEAYTAALRQAGLTAELRDFWMQQLARPTLNEKRRLDLIYGMLEIHAWKEALPPLAELAAKRKELVPLYVESAVEAGRKQDAVSFLKSQLDRTDLAGSDRQADLYALIDHGGYGVSLPYIRALAAASGGPWLAAYEDALRKLDRLEELATLWKTRAARPDAMPDQKRSLAFQLIDLGRKDWAAAILQNLAQSANPDSQDVADLLFLWGPKPPPAALDWLEQRSREATGPERAAWWNHLLDLGAANRVAALAANNLPQPGQGAILLEVYLRALAQLGDKRQFSAAIDRELSALDRPEPARTLAHLARESGMDAAAEAAYTRVVSLAPGDLEAHHWLGTYAFARGTYSVAEDHLKSLLDSAEGAYDDNFYYAEILWRKGSRGPARLYYGRAIRAIERLPLPPPEALAQRAQALARCGFVEKSLEEFRSLVAASPGKQDLRADFVAILLENSRYSEARRVLSANSGPEGSRLVALRAQLLTATAQKREALDVLEDFAAAHPQSAETFAGLAVLDQSMDLNRLARSHFAQAASLEPDNEDYRNSLEEAQRNDAPNIETEFLRRTVQGEEGEYLVRIIGEQVLGHALKLHFAVDQDAASIAGVRSASGTIAPFRGVVRRGEATLQYETENGLRIEGSLYGSDTGPGVGAAVVRPDTQGSSAIRVELGRPYWEFTQSLAEGGTRDRVEIHREFAGGPRISGSLALALNRYKLKGVSSAASSAAAQGRLTIGVLMHPRLSFEYNLDGEYKLSAASLADAGGNPFQPLPLVSREVHSLGMAAAVEPVRHLQANVSGGYAIDRLGGRAPFITISLNYRDQGRFAGGVDFDRRLYFLNTARAETIIGGHVSLRF